MNEQRRGFLGALAAFFGFGALAKSEKQYIDGIGVLRHPPGYVDCGGKIVSNQEIARELMGGLCPGSIVVFPTSRDSHGDYEWDFRIEGGDPKQVKIERKNAIVGKVEPA